MIIKIKDKFNHLNSFNQMIIIIILIKIIHNDIIAINYSSNIKLIKVKYQTYLN